MSNILNLLFPPRCPACRKVMEDDKELIHPECRKAFKPIIEPRCFKCGKHIQEAEEAICPECREKGHSYTYGFSVFEYNDAARGAMLDFKKNGWRKNGDFFAAEAIKNLGKLLKRMDPEVLIPVPVSRRRLNERGFNQSEYIARIIGDALNIPVDNELLIRKSGKTQKELSRKERMANALKSFECSEPARYKRVCIIDDVYTTGNTVEGCTRALMDAGVQETGFLTIFLGDVY